MASWAWRAAIFGVAKGRGDLVVIKSVLAKLMRCIPKSLIVVIHSE